jgi:hypothetical protein
MIIDNQERCQDDIQTIQKLQTEAVEELKEANEDRSNKMTEILQVMSNDDTQLIQDIKELETRQEERNSITKKELQRELKSGMLTVSEQIKQSGLNIMEMHEAEMEIQG